MPRKNLTKEIIVNEAIALINQDGYAKFTLQALSRHLDIKAPSLYNHFKNLDEINVEVFKKLVNEYNAFKSAHIDGLRREKAIWAYANAVREYSQNYPEQFKLILLFPSLINNKEISIPVVISILMDILDQYAIGETQKYHFQRIFRSFMSGFITYERVGFFRNNDISKDESYHFAIQTFISALELEEIRNR